ncbi:hypothetical protein NC651_038422 [Populus alba x Populus x berolinensis]|nr:hypothetical protein NC651_038422 [Populus alba x Populus x berolinensis]
MLAYNSLFPCVDCPEKDQTGKHQVVGPSIFEPFFASLYL